ncbi:hypothetical protein SNEBB_007122 [Seison nebaliae]|nr:hypothetical protein SNEBB_007122 [Seison nebaliae]
MSLPHSLSYIGNIVHGIISQSTKIGQSHPSARRKHSNASSSVSASIDVPLNRCKIVPVEFSGEHITSLVVPNQFIERCESSHEQNGVKRNSLEVYESLTEFGGNNLTPITPILLDRKLTHGEEKELHYQMESKSTSKELLNKSEGDQNIDENEDSSSVWDVKDDNSTYIPTNNSSDASDIKPSLVEPIHPSSMKNLIEEVNYPLTSDDPKLIASYVNGKDDYCDDGPRGFFIKRESQTNTLSSNLSSRQTINESYSKILTDLPSLERRDSRQFYGLSDSDIRDRKPSQLDYLTLNLIQKNYELSCRQCGCMLDCWNSHCVIPSRCCHMLCFTCGRDNLKLPTTEVHHEIMDQLTFEEKRLLFEYEELLQIHNYQPIVRSEHVLIPWNITTYQVPDTEILFGCKFETRCPKVCPICGLLSTKYWEIITPPFC